MSPRVIRTRPIRVLVTDPVHAIVAETLSQLTERERFEFHGVHAEIPDVPGPGIRRFWPCPPPDDPSFATALLEVVARCRPQLIVPWADRDAGALSGLRDELTVLGARLVLPDAETVRVCQDKLTTYTTLTALGLPTIESVPVSSAEDLTAAARDLGYPSRRLRLKTRDGQGGQGQWRIAERFEPHQRGGPPTVPLDALLLAIERADGRPLGFVLQPEVVGVDVTVDFLAHEGEILLYVMRSATNWSSGVIGAGSIVDIPSASEAIASFAAAVRWSNLGNVQFFLTPAGEPLIYEFNARASGATGIDLVAGVDILHAALLYTLFGPDVVQRRQARRVHFRRVWKTEWSPQRKAKPARRPQALAG